MMHFRFDTGVESIQVGHAYQDDDGVSLVTINTKPETFRRVYITSDAGAEVGPFDSMADAFAWLRARDIPFDEAEAARAVATHDA